MLLRTSGPLFLAVILCIGLWESRAAAQSAPDGEQAIIELYNNKQLFDKAKYKEVRAAFARHFEAKHQAKIKKGFGPDGDAINKWLAERPTLRDNLFTALDERFDRIDVALAIFRDLWRASAVDVEKHPNLATATAITWDDSRAIYDYQHHQVRTKSNMPRDMLDAVGNFKYIVGDKNLDARCKNLPWEFLVFIVDHRTPLVERQWAQVYSRAAVGLSSWHKDVPYDHAMLDAELAKGPLVNPKLAGKDYSLPNIRAFGGVCAMQADFAARVGKSVGVPAVYCSGESSYRGNHAWWMYVQVLQSSPDRVSFNLNSDGRFVGFIKDAFYTGKVLDPHSGVRILDRDMERRLHMAGSDPPAKRQADLLMRAYSWLDGKLGLDAAQQVAYLDRVLKICPLSEEPWIEFAKLVKSNELAADQKAIVKKYVSSLQSQFRSYPDFIERVMPSMLSLHEPAEQVKLYQQAVGLYEKAGRPDLSCQARLGITDALVNQEKWQAAFDGLYVTIYRFPTEGRYVPKLLLKAEKVCGKVKSGPEKLAQIYVDLVPKLAVYYREDDDKIPEQIYNQAQSFLTSNKLENYSNALKLRMGKKF